MGNRMLRWEEVKDPVAGSCGGGGGGDGGWAAAAVMMDLGFRALGCRN
jgi:hypothetical protein